MTHNNYQYSKYSKLSENVYNFKSSSTDEKRNKKKTEKHETKNRRIDY